MNLLTVLLTPRLLVAPLFGQEQQPRATLEAHGQKGAVSIAFNPDGRLFVLPTRPHNHRLSVGWRG
jgi:hypothetical protein